MGYRRAKAIYWKKWQASNQAAPCNAWTHRHHQTQTPNLSDAHKPWASQHRCQLRPSFLSKPSEKLGRSVLPKYLAICLYNSGLDLTLTPRKPPMRLYETLQKARSEEDVKDAYIKALGLKKLTKGLIDIQTDEIWFEAKDTGKHLNYK
jgi:hypothetical protein